MGYCSLKSHGLQSRVDPWHLPQALICPLCQCWIHPNSPNPRAMLPYKSVYLKVHLFFPPSKTFSCLYPASTAVLYSPFNIHFPLSEIINLELQAIRHRWEASFPGVAFLFLAIKWCNCASRLHGSKGIHTKSKPENNSFECCANIMKHKSAEVIFLYYSINSSWVLRY